MSGRRLPVILALGTTQTLAWASSVYLPAILADPMAHDLGISANWIFGAYSGALVIAGLLGPRIGRQIDRVGGRPVLSISNLTLAGGLALLGFTYSIPMLIAAWVLLGIGMGYGLYDAAFGALGRIYGEAARGPITGITLIAGFASTVGWPLTAYGLAHFGWRDTCLAWAAAHIVIGLPLNILMLPPVPTAKAAAQADSKPHIPIDRTMVLLALAFALAWIVTSAMAAHFPRILEAAGATRVEAIAAGALIGPAQVFARMMEASFLKRLPSDHLGPPRLPDASARRGHPRADRRRRRKHLCDLPRRGQRRDHDRARHAAARDLRPEELRLPARPDRRAGADGAGGRASAVRLPDRCDGKPCSDRVFRAQPCGDGGIAAVAREIARLSASKMLFPSRSNSRTTGP